MGKINVVDLASLIPVRNKEERKKGRSNWTIMILIAAGLVMMLMLVGCKSGSYQPTQAPPTATPLLAKAPGIDGSTLLETRCSVCHSANRAKQAKKTREQWDRTVTRMMGKGAQLTEAEKSLLVDYLAKTYGP